MRIDIERKQMGKRHKRKGDTTGEGTHMKKRHIGKIYTEREHGRIEDIHRKGT